MRPPGWSPQIIRGGALPNVPHLSNNHPWTTPIGNTREMLGLVPGGASVSTAEQWQRLGLVTLHENNPGRGTTPVRVAADVLQLSLLAEFSTMAVPLGAARLAWACTIERAWFGSGPAGVVIFTNKDRDIVVQSFGEAGPPMASLPDLITAFRIPPFITRIAKRVGIREVAA